MTALNRAMRAFARAARAARLRRRNGRTSPRLSRTYPGDYDGPFEVLYDPHPDGRPDPGEIVWTWVPYEEDFTRGKDRPVLLVGRDGPWLLGLMLSSQDHDGDAADEARWGRHWFDIGAGTWDAENRPSEVRVDRVLRIHPKHIRREGAVLDARKFARVASEMANIKGW